MEEAALTGKEEEARIAALREEEKQSENIKNIEELKREPGLSSPSDRIKAIEEELKAENISFLQNLLYVPDPKLDQGALLDVAKHLGNLPFRVWKKMRRVIQYRLNMM
ncbi:unnamed protein product [Coregonus sp. 'balchen']|nr:unnamed protein product [Coregonus sp. 'balchen']